MARPLGPVPRAPRAADLVEGGISRDRAILAARIGQLRADAGWTYTELSRQCGMNATYLKQIEAGIRSPGVDRLFALARAFRLQSIEQLFGPLPTEDIIGLPEDGDNETASS